MDGMYCGGNFCHTHEFGVRTNSGVSTSDTAIRPFVFANLEVTGEFLNRMCPETYSEFVDDDTFLESSSHTELGEIYLRVWRCEMKATLPSGTRNYVKATRFDRKVHERSKKATAHKTQ